MSNVTYNTPNGRFSAQFDVSTQAELFDAVGTFEEVFVNNSNCGKCKSANVKFQTRIVEDNPFRELVCKDCRAKLSFGAHKKGGGIFPKRKDSEGKYLPDGGWMIYNKTTGKEE